MYEARKISNFILANFDAQRFEITNLRLNKLLYFIHAVALRTKANGLVRNHFEAWQYGPVIRPVFDAFKFYGDQWIKAPAEYLDYASGKRAPIPYHDIGAEDAAMIVNIFNEYSCFSTSQLVALSHEKDGPWETIYKSRLADQNASLRIPNDLIRKHFVGGELMKHLGTSFTH